MSCVPVRTIETDDLHLKNSIVRSSIIGSSVVQNYLVEGDEIRLPLIDVESSVEEGAKVFVSRESGHCVLCHKIADIEASFQGNLGPDLSTVGARLTPAQLRYRIVDASRLNPHTIMPPYFRTAGLSQVATEVVGETVLSEIQIEQLVEFLASKGVSPE
jgi:sulfur-oxidizing protein SoxX